MREGLELSIIPMDMISEPTHQLRQKITEEGLEELKRSMARQGLINPITVRRKENAYEIVSGHRRYLAAKELAWPSIRAIVVDRTDEEMRLEAIHENLHREDLSPVEESRQVGILHGEFGYPIKEIARITSKSVSWVSSRLDMLDWPSNILEAVDVGAISVSAAKELVAIHDDDSRNYYLDHAIKSGATRELCAFWRGRWEVEKITRDPSAQGDATFSISPPPMEPLLHCFWCNTETPIRLLDHLRFCPECIKFMVESKKQYEWELFKTSQASAEIEKVKPPSGPQDHPGS